MWLCPFKWMLGFVLVVDLLLYYVIGYNGGNSNQNFIRFLSQLVIILFSYLNDSSIIRLNKLFPIYIPFWILVVILVLIDTIRHIDYAKTNGNTNAQLVIFIVMSIIRGIILLFSYKCRLKIIPDVPYPKMDFMLGHLSMMLKSHSKTWDLTVSLSNLYNGTFQIIIPGQNYCIRTCDPVNIKHILRTNFDNYVKKPQGEISFVEEFFGTGIFAVDGKEAKKQRKIASHLFSTRNLRDYMEKAFQEHGLMLCQVLDNHLEKENIDMQDFLLRFTMDSFTKIAFGVSINSLSSNPRPEFAMAFDRIQELLLERQIYPRFIWRTQRFLKTKREAEIKKHQKILHKFVDDVIDEREKNMKEQDTLSYDLMSSFIADAKKNNQSISRIELRDIIMNFMIAGRDTTACLLTWALVEFHQNPEWEEKCLQEINDIIGPNNPGHDNVKKLTTLDKFLNEVLRLHPPVPFDKKIALHDDVWPDGTKIPAGTDCGYLPYAAGRWEKNWGKDYMEFKPERWDDLENLMTDDKKDFDYKFITFNAGPRVCLGKGMAYMEAKMCLVMLLTRYKFHLVQDHNLSYKISIILQLKHGLMMNVNSRIKI